jgi:tetratricopeptide (TPR) repeat protein
MNLRLCRPFSSTGQRPGWAVVFGLALAGLWAQAPSFAQDDAPVDRTKAISTVVGAPASANCALVAAAGRHDDEAFHVCNQALSRERLNRAQRIATLTNRGTLYLNRGKAQPLSKQSDGAAALTDFDAVIRLDPANAVAHLNRGAALVMIGKPGPAVGAITEALGLGLKDPQLAYLNRGAAREALGDVAGAYEDYKTALEIAPDWAVAEGELARFARSRRDRLAERLGEPVATAPTVSLP